MQLHRKTTDKISPAFTGVRRFTVDVLIIISDKYAGIVSLVLHFNNNTSTGGNKYKLINHDNL